MFQTKVEIFHEDTTGRSTTVTYDRPHAWCKRNSTRVGRGQFTAVCSLWKATAPNEQNRGDRKQLMW